MANCPLDTYLARPRSTAISPDGRYVAVESVRHIAIYDAVKGARLPAQVQLERASTDSAVFISFSFTGQHLATADLNGLSIWSLTPESPPERVDGPVSATGFVRAMTFLPGRDGRNLAAAIYTWTDGKAALSVQRWTSGHLYFDTVMEGKPTTYAAFSRDGRRLAAADTAGYLRVFDVETNSLIASTHQLAVDSISAIAISPEGDLVACGSDVNILRVWHIATGAVFSVQLEGCDHITTLAFAPDGSQIACGSRSTSTIRFVGHDHYARSRY